MRQTTAIHELEARKPKHQYPQIARQARLLPSNADAAMSANTASIYLAGYAPRHHRREPPPRDKPCKKLVAADFLRDQEN